MVLEAYSSLFWLSLWLAVTLVATFLSTFAVERINLLAAFFTDYCIPLAILGLLGVITTLITFLIGLWFGSPALTVWPIPTFTSLFWIVLFNAVRHAIGFANALMHGPK